MEIRLAQPQDINAWMALVEQVRDQFPGLETSKAMEEHRATVLDFIRQSSAICAEEAGQIVGTLLFSRENSMLCFLAVDPSCRRQHIARKMVHFMLPLMEKGRGRSPGLLQAAGLCGRQADRGIRQPCPGVCSKAF